MSNKRTCLPVPLSSVIRASTRLPARPSPNMLRTAASQALTAKLAMRATKTTVKVDYEPCEESSRNRVTRRIRPTRLPSQVHPPRTESAKATRPRSGKVQHTINASSFIKTHRSQFVLCTNMGTHTLDARDKNMPDVDTLIELIRDHRNTEALEMLNASRGLATEHSDRSGQLNGASPLHWAAHRNATEVCQRLIELGANVNDSASDWWLTPLSWGADAGSAEAVELLLKRGADINQDAIVGTTALHAAAMGGSTQGKRDPDAYKRTAEILIRNGADINRRANKPRTPLDEAIDNENDAVANVLRQHGALLSKTST